MKYLVLAVAIVAVAIIACVALYKGMDGVLGSLAFTAIGGLAAWGFRLPRRRKGRKK